jgi:hypothetical protein
LKFPDIAAVDRILKTMSIGQNGRTFNLHRADKETLLDRLISAFCIQSAAVEVASDKLRQEREVRRSEIQQLAWDLAQLLRADATDSGRVSRCYSPTEADPRRVLILLSWAARMAKKSGVELPSATEAARKLIGDLTARSHFSCLVGELLGPIFDEFFPLSGPEYTTVDGATDSPKVRFISAVLLEFSFRNRHSEPHAFGSIAKALTDAKLEYTRRKPRGHKRQLLRT